MDPSTENHVRLLSIFHYVLAALSALFSLFPLAYIGFGVAILSGVFDDGHGAPPPRPMGWFIIAFGTVMFLAGVTYVVLVALAGRFLARRRHWTFCIVVAALSCTFFPFGTVLGVFTIIVLARDGVKQEFETGARPAAT
jgi:predicted membrane channel-forming protein YqfA (hemolysin III family)